MNRRGFLSFLAGAAAGALILPARTYFLPPKGGWTGPHYWAFDPAGDNDWAAAVGYRISEDGAIIVQDVLYDYAWKQPDPALCDLLKLMQEDVDRITGMPPPREAMPMTQRLFGSRLHERDLAGHILDQDPTRWELLKL